MHFRQLLPLALAAALGGCTTVSVAGTPQALSRRDVFVTTADLKEPYESLGLVQVTRRGVLLFGFVDPAGTDLATGLHASLVPEVRRAGGDGAINVRFQRTEYVLPVRVLAALLFFLPLPSEVTLTAEVVRLRRPVTADAPVAPADAPATSP